MYFLAKTWVFLFQAIEAHLFWSNPLPIKTPIEAAFFKPSMICPLVYKYTYFQLWIEYRKVKTLSAYFLLFEYIEEIFITSCLRDKTRSKRRSLQSNFPFLQLSPKQYFPPDCGIRSSGFANQRGSRGPRFIKVLLRYTSTGSYLLDI